MHSQQINMNILLSAKKKGNSKPLNPILTVNVLKKISTKFLQFEDEYELQTTEINNL